MRAFPKTPLCRRASKRLHWSGLYLIALLFFTPGAGLAKRPVSLATRINTILNQAGARRGFWGIEVVRLSDGRRLYARNAGRLFQPASNMKLFTAAAALSKLGPDFIFRTTVESNAPVDSQGRVSNLILVGRGDPNLGSRVLPYHLKTETRSSADLDFQNLADQVVSKGVRDVTGDLIVDTRYYVEEPYGPEWAIDDMIWDYGAPVTALAFNDNSLTLHVEPGPTVGSEASVTLDPVPDYYKIHAGVETGSSETPEKLFIERAPGSMELDVGGHVQVGSGGTATSVAIQDPPRLIGEMFRRELEQRGVRVEGKVVVRRLAPMEAVERGNPVPDSEPQAVLAEHDSLPLREDIKVMMKVSQNLHAEMLLRTMARQIRGVGSREAGLEVLCDFMHEAGIPSDAVYFSGGSGLSRTTLVTPEALTELLRFMARSPFFQDFYDALPVAGVDGTLADRFERTVAKGHIHAKTGSLEHVNSLSGYMDARGGARLAFVIIGNNDRMKPHEATHVIDQIALEIYRYCAGARRAR